MHEFVSYDKNMFILVTCAVLLDMTNLWVFFCPITVFKQIRITKFYYLNENLIQIHRSRHNPSLNLIPIPMSSLKSNPRIKSRLNPKSMYNSCKKLIQYNKLKNKNNVLTKFSNVWFQVKDY